MCTGCCVVDCAVVSLSSCCGNCCVAGESEIMYLCCCCENRSGSCGISHFYIGCVEGSIYCCVARSMSKIFSRALCTYVHSAGERYGVVCIKGDIVLDYATCGEGYGACMSCIISKGRNINSLIKGCT